MALRERKPSAAVPSRSRKAVGKDEEEEGSQALVIAGCGIIGLCIAAAFFWYISTLVIAAQLQTIGSSRLKTGFASAATTPPPVLAEDDAELSIDERRRRKRDAKLAEEAAKFNDMVTRKPFKAIFTVAGEEGRAGAGNITISVTPKWAPRGADRFHHLIKIGYYNGCRFFRVIPGFMAQWGISSDPEQNTKWKNRKFPDDPVTQSNTRGRITFATSGGDSRTTQLFINYGDNARLDTQGFSPFGEVTEGMQFVDGIYAEYREQPKQDMIQKHGLEYLQENFPKLSYIVSAQVVEDPEDAAGN